MSDKKCEQCRKDLGKKFTERSGKKFCSDNCMKAYGKAHPSKKNVCEFC